MLTWCLTSHKPSVSVRSPCDYGGVGFQKPPPAQDTVESVLRITLLIALPAGVGLSSAVRTADEHDLRCR